MGSVESSVDGGIQYHTAESYFYFKIQTAMTYEKEDRAMRACSSQISNFDSESARSGSKGRRNATYHTYYHSPPVVVNLTVPKVCSLHPGFEFFVA